MDLASMLRSIHPKRLWILVLEAFLRRVEVLQIIPAKRFCLSHHFLPRHGLGTPFLLGLIENRQIDWFEI